MKHSDRFRVFGSFTKVEEQPDGTLYVEGVASSEARDSQGEMIRAGAMKKALPDYLRFPTIREMHQAWAAGKTTAAVVADDGKTHIATKIVDRDACLKVKEGVYGGFSIGGTVPPGGRNKDDPTIIEQIQLTEISIVDRPANPDAVISLVKFDGDPMPDTTPPAPPAQAQLPLDAGEPVGKSLSHVQWAAGLLQQLSDLQADKAFEAQWNGTNSKAAGELKALAAQMAGCLQRLVKEETDAMSTTDKAAAPPPVQKAAEPTPAAAPAAALPAPAPAAAPPAAAPTVTIQAVDAEAIRRALESPGAVAAFRKALGLPDPVPAAEPAAAEPPPAAPPAPAAGEPATKAAALPPEAEAVVKAAGEELRKAMAQRDEALKAVADLRAELERRPKGAVKAVPVEKGADTGLPPAAAQPAPAPVGDPKQAAGAQTLDLIKAAHQRPIPVVPTKRPSGA